MTLSKFKPTGKFIITCISAIGELKWVEIINNLNVSEGLTDILGVYFSSDTQSANWYIGLKGSNETPADGWNAAGIGTQFTEFTGYSQATRVQWVEAGASSKSISNSASPSVFSINASGTLYGAFLVNISTKGSTSGKLWCCSNFSTSRPVNSGDSISIIYVITSQDI